MTQRPSPASPWSSADTVAGFATSPPNQTLMAFGAAELASGRGSRLVDIGCGAGRNAWPLASLGWSVIGIDSSEPMLAAAMGRAAAETPSERLLFARAAMDALPVPDRTADLVIAHGIWNLAASGAEFRRAIREAARIARPGAGLFVFTFSRRTIPPDARPVEGETFVFTEFSGRPQCFLTERQLFDELAQAGFVPDPAVPLTEHNLPRPGTLRSAGPPVIYEASFRFPLTGARGTASSARCAGS